MATSALCNRHKLRQQQGQQEQQQQQQQQQGQQLTTLVSLSPESATTTSCTAATLPRRIHSTTFSHAAATSASHQAPLHDGNTTSASNQHTPTQILIRNQTPTSTPTQLPRLRTGSKRKRLDQSTDAGAPVAPTKRKKTCMEFLRKGQWTPTEERLTRLLIEAFEEGRLPIYTGIRLRGYLAVQLQCDPMRVSKKLCAGTIDHKHVPKNYGQRKFKLRKKGRWDSDELAARMTEIKRLTAALWVEARVRKPSFLTLSSTRNGHKRQAVDETDVVLSPPSPTQNCSPPSTPEAKKRKALPIIYFHLAKLKRYAIRDDDASSSSELASPVHSADSDSEPARLDGESLQAAYDLLTLCSPGARTLRWHSKRDQEKLKDVRVRTTLLAAVEETSCQVGGCGDARVKRNARAFARTA